MTSLAASIAVGAGLALVAGCTSRPLQPDAGGGGSISFDAGATGDGGAAADGALFSGRRSFVVTSTLDQGPSIDGGAPGGPLSHTFTMVVDGDKRTAIAGTGPYPYKPRVEPAPGGFHVVGLMGFDVGPMGTYVVDYSDISFRFDPAGRLLGSAAGTMFPACSDARSGVDVTMSLTGVDDTIAPTITLVPGGDIADPMGSFRVLASEPLLADVQPVLRAAGGDVVVLTPSSEDGFVAMFYKPNVLLRYGETYTLDLSGVRDFAGNAAVGTTADSLTFSTRPLPPLVAPDGFESVTGATLGGAEVLAGAGDPIISGARSLYAAPASAIGAPAWTTQFALRLAVAPGASVVRLSYRDVNSNGLTIPEFMVASVGGPLAVVSADGPSGSATSVTIDGTTVTLGPIGTATIRLPQNVSGEIVIACRTDGAYLCNTPRPTEISGIIIDDLRVE